MLEEVEALFDTHARLYSDCSLQGVGARRALSSGPDANSTFANLASTPSSRLFTGTRWTEMRS